jgi:hypothetical protein
MICLFHCFVPLVIHQTRYGMSFAFDSRTVQKKLTRQLPFWSSLYQILSAPKYTDLRPIKIAVNEKTNELVGYDNTLQI